MFDVGGPEFLFLVVLALLVFGPRRLPQIGRTVGDLMAQMRHAVRDFKGNIEREVALEDVRRAADQVKELRKEARDTVADLSGVGPPPPADPTRVLRQSRATDDSAAEASPEADGSEDERRD